MAADEAKKPDKARRQPRWGEAERRRVIGCLMVGAMVAAPFIALLYGINVGLAMMGLALLATSYATLSAARHTTIGNRQTLRLLAAGNAILALLCVAALVLRIR